MIIARVLSGAGLGVVSNPSKHELMLGIEAIDSYLFYFSRRQEPLGVQIES